LEVNDHLRQFVAKIGATMTNGEINSYENERV